MTAGVRPVNPSQGPTPVDARIVDLPFPIHALLI